MQNKAVLIIVVLLVLAGGYFFISNSNKSTQPSATDTMMKDDISVDSMDKGDEAMPKDNGMDGIDSGDGAMMDDKKVTDENSMMVGEAKTFQVHGGAFYFDPTEITVTEGDTVKIVFTNDGGTHDFVLDEFDVKTPTLTEADATTEVTFVADKAGTYEYYCSVGNHRAMGMVGTLVVEAK